MNNKMNAVLSSILVSFTLLIGSLHAADRPNILWITAEDMSATLGCYGDKFANSPNIDQLSQRSVRYTNAFASTPVCSPARNCLITGCYPTSLGTQNMRSSFPLPEDMQGFPALLRKAGYYTSNNVKTDYNTSDLQRLIDTCWDESSNTAHWRNRKDKSQPFFSVFNLMTSHQSRTMVWPYEKFQQDIQSQLTSDQIHSAVDVPVPPYYPDTPVIRKTLARFYDCVTVMDHQVGQLLSQLEEDNLTDNTIIFFYSDHGSGMPRHKRALLDSGMHVPLIIHFPEMYQHWATKKPGESTGRLVSFVDYAPTLLHMLNIKPSHPMQGTIFLGKPARQPRWSLFGHRDRVDEAFDLARSVRDNQFLYIRNFMPHLSYNQPTVWPDNGEIRHEFYRLTNKETMTPAQWHFAGPTRPVEELYDCEKDPLNLNNLANNELHLRNLINYRSQMQEQRTNKQDLGFIPEAIAWNWFAGKSPYLDKAKLKAFDLPAIYQAADLVGKGKESDFFALLKSNNPALRYWGAIGLASMNELSTEASLELLTLTKDESPTARIAAADAMGRHGNKFMAALILVQQLENKDPNVVLYAARTMELLKLKEAKGYAAMKRLDERVAKLYPQTTAATFVLSREQDLAMFTHFSTQAYLKHFETE